MRKNPKGLLPSAGCTRTAAGAGSTSRATPSRTDPRRLQDRRAPPGPKRGSAVSAARSSLAERRPHRPQPAARLHLQRPPLRGPSPATRWPRRCSPTACSSSAAASSITGRAASCAPGPRSRTRSSSSRPAARTEPNSRATADRALRRARRREPECWPTLGFDLGARQRPAVAAFPGRLLLQDLHVAAEPAG